MVTDKKEIVLEIPTIAPWRKLLGGIILILGGGILSFAFYMFAIKDACSEKVYRIVVEQAFTGGGNVFGCSDFFLTTFFGVILLSIGWALFSQKFLIKTIVCPYCGFETSFPSLFGNLPPSTTCLKCRELIFLRWKS